MVLLPGFKFKAIREGVRQSPESCQVDVCEVAGMHTAYW